MGGLMTCCDTRFLYSLYVIDEHSSYAETFMAIQNQAVSVTALGIYELEHALIAAEYRKLLPTNQARYLIKQFENDLKNELFIFTQTNLNMVLEEAKKLVIEHTLIKGYRAFDVLHVAAALRLKSTHFLTFDAAQKHLAMAEGLVVPI